MRQTLSKYEYSESASISTATIPRVKTRCIARSETSWVSIQIICVIPNRRPKRRGRQAQQRSCLAILARPEERALPSDQFVSLAVIKVSILASPEGRALQPSIHGRLSQSLI